jgi:paxillin
MVEVSEHKVEPPPIPEPGRSTSRPTSFQSGHRKTSSTNQIPTVSSRLSLHAGRPLARSPSSRPVEEDAQMELNYQVNGARWVEKQDARSLRLALQEMDLVEEERLHAAAQQEASELVWKHQNPSAAENNPHAPYRYKEHLEKDSVSKRVGWAQDGVVVRKGRVEGSIGTGSRSASGESDSAATTSSSSSRVPSDGSIKSAASRASKMRRRSLQFAAAVIKKGEEKIGGIRPSSLRRTSAKRDHILEEQTPQIVPKDIPSNSNVARVASAFGSVHARNPFSRVRNARSSMSVLDSCPPTENRLPYLERVEIQRNPPSQTRNPGYTSTAARPGTPLETPKPQEDEIKTKDGKEVRDDEIRKATSMSLKDRSPKLPTPTMVSDAPGRPIVSFKNDWSPKEVTLTQETSSLPPVGKPKVYQGTSSPSIPTFSIDSTPAPPSRANTFPLVNSHNAPTASRSKAPSIPIVSVSESPNSRNINATAPVPTISIYQDPSPRPLPSIYVASAPSISVSPPSISVPSPPTISVSAPSIAVSPPTISVSGESGSSVRPLPTPSHTGRQRPHWAVPTQATARSSVLCHDCALPIAGRIVTAAGVRFHPACFRCHHCSEALECVAFFPEPEKNRDERLAQGDHDDGLRFYCHLDYHEFFSPRCKSCKTPIEGDVVVACGSEWHAGHFFCAQCGDPFEQTTPYVEKDGYAWCVCCHTNRFSTKCKGCRKPVTDMVVKALGAEWHEGCFCCHVSPSGPSGPSPSALLTCLRNVVASLRMGDIS